MTNSKDPIIGRTITDIRQMTQEEADEFGFFARPVLIFLDDGSYLVPSRDDEGNDGGALFLECGEKSFIYPVARG